MIEKNDVKKGQGKLPTSLRGFDDYLRKDLSKEQLESAKKNGDLVTRNNVYILPLKYFHIETGYNIRPLNNDHVEDLVVAIAQGQPLPPVRVEMISVDGEPKARIKDGQHRVAAALCAVERGLCALPGLTAMDFDGNEADAILHMLKSSEGLPLQPLERAEGYKRLMGQGWKPAVIAERANKSSVHVDRLLILANAEENVKQLVREDLVAADVVIDTIIATRGTDRDAYEELKKGLEVAKSLNKPRVTKSHMALAGVAPAKLSKKEIKTTIKSMSRVALSIQEVIKTADPEKLDALVNIEFTVEEAMAFHEFLNKGAAL